MKAKTKRKVAAIATGLLALTAIPFIPQQTVEAADEYQDNVLALKQEIKVVDVTDHVHEAGITTPNITFAYFFDPVVDDAELPDTFYYETEIGKFPDNSNPTDGTYKEQTTTLAIASVPSNSDGVVSGSVVLNDKDTAANGVFSKIAAAKWGDKNKIYRYKVTIQNVYATSDTDKADIRIGNTDFTGGDGSIYCDVQIDKNGAISTIVLHTDPASTEKTDKVEGFTDSAELALQYNTYDVVITSDYVGDTNNYNAANVTYTMAFSNLPDYISTPTSILISSGTTTNEWVGENRQNWELPTAITGNAGSYKGPIQNGWHVTFSGIPYTGKNGSAVQFTSNANYDGLGADAVNYNDAIYLGSNVSQVTADITDLTTFLASSLSTDYGNVENTEIATVDTTAHTAALTSTANVMASADSAANNVRFVIFDPSLLQFVLVGVSLYVISGVILVAAAAVGCVLLFRRKRTTL